MPRPISVFWFRRDLRLNDNVGLDAALQSGKPVLCVFIFDKNILSDLAKDDARVTFIYQKLKEIDEVLRRHNSTLYTLHDEPEKAWERLTNTFNIAAVYANKDYEPYAIKRDKKIANWLKNNDTDFNTFKDQVIFEKDEVVKADGLPYTVYTPYKNKWLSEFTRFETKIEAPANLQYMFHHQLEFPTIEALGFEKSNIKVKPYSLSNLEDYAKNRDLPSIAGTSHLSVHLRFGTVSIREVVNQVKSNPVFLSELIWREFFMQILYHFPEVVEHNFKRKYDGVVWKNSESDFKKWCEGKTGYPMVDAGMRELNATGYMHNRVRMITAGFLCKHLLIDWRWGEAYFASKLLDYDLAANNGNWQWAAGTGCDAAPYFRIFNPTEQQKKFDKKLSYVKKWLPEIGSPAYPLPMVDHKMAKKRALDAYKFGIEAADV